MKSLTRFQIIAGVILVTGGVELPTAAVGQTTNYSASDSAFVSVLRARLDSAAASDQFSGAVLVTRDGRTVFEGAYGFADRERRIRNTLLTEFRLGSMGKIFTGVSALQLVQAGKLQ